MNPLERTDRHDASAVTALGAVGNFIRFTVTDGCGRGWAEQAKVVEGVEDYKRTNRLSEIRVA